MDPHVFDPHLTDPDLLKNHSEFRSFTTSQHTYPKIRVFYRQHAKAEELYRSNGPLPLLVFIPGLGGSVAQFHPLLTSLVDLAPCLAIDYPGCGRSDFAPTAWDAYTSEALGELLEVIIDEYRDKEAEQTIVLVGHSMGTSYAAWLANPKVAHKTEVADFVVGLVGICPVPGPLDEDKALWARRLMWLPGWLMDLFRAWDGMGGLQSPSVTRFVGEDADNELRQLQYRFNKQSRTPVWRRMFYGYLPEYRDGKPLNSLAGLDTWAGVKCPVYLIAGEADHIVPAADMQNIVKALKGHPSQSPAAGEPLAPAAAAPVDLALGVDGHRVHVPQTIGDIREEDFHKVKRNPESDNSQDDPSDDPSTPQEQLADVPAQSRHPRKFVLSTVLPAPANHTCLYMPSHSRVIAGLISDFLACRVTGRLSLAWQLQYLSREGKWDVKNLNKWKSVQPVSEPIGPPGGAPPLFRALKTLREADEVHTPHKFTGTWPGQITDVVDISKDQPVYDPRGLERGGIQYHKFPTVSKVPPQPEEIDAFIKLIDSIRARRAEESATGLIGVHCHYGFNRTGYFIVCYLVERCGMTVHESIETFARARPNGIRHSHFLDRLYVRYNVDGAGTGQQ